MKLRGQGHIYSQLSYWGEESLHVVINFRSPNWIIIITFLNVQY